jgi:Xaa-Pro aminopeptidase
MIMVKEKIEQALEILKEENIDCWLTFVRESGTMRDPAMELVVGTGITWQSAFILTADGDTIAIVGSLDKANQEDHGYYRSITGYVQSIEADLLKTLQKLDPNKIAVNYSLNSPSADGLTYGMFLQLQKYLDKINMTGRLVSSEPVLNKLRGRKSKTEIGRVKNAIAQTLTMFDQVTGFIRPGRTEREIAGFLTGLVEKAGVELAWDPDHCPAVFTGPDTAGAHAGPTDREVKPGHVLNIDFGIRKEDYCSDLQRSWYIRRPGETEAPEAVRRGFQVIFDSISEAARKLQPGVTGSEIDQIARGYILDHGYEEYPHALGHQIGRAAHDGGGLLAPKWERYGTLPDQPVERDQLYTLEPRLTIDTYGIATIEEIVLVTDNGCEFLSERQTDIFLI